jgi:hypothetical protein
MEALPSREGPPSKRFIHRRVNRFSAMFNPPPTSDWKKGSRTRARSFGPKPNPSNFREDAPSWAEARRPHHPELSQRRCDNPLRSITSATQPRRPTRLDKSGQSHLPTLCTAHSPFPKFAASLPPFVLCLARAGQTGPVAAPHTFTLTFTSRPHRCAKRCGRVTPRFFIRAVKSPNSRRNTFSLSHF